MNRSSLVCVSALTLASCTLSTADEDNPGTLSAASTTATVYNYGTLAHPGACLDASGAGTANGTQIQEWWCNGSGAQAYAVLPQADGTVNLLNTHANKCVDVYGAGTGNGNKIDLWDCNGTVAQKFILRPAGNGFVNIVNPHSNKCLDVKGDNPADGTVVQLYDCNGTNAQLWNPAAVGTITTGGGSSGGGSSGSSGGPGAGWKLTWSDEFNGPSGSAVDASKWSYDTGGGGWGNNELEYYTSGTQNAVVENGNLVITATHAGASPHSCWYGTCQYTSARLNTAGKFSQQYGWFEARIKIPKGQGVWPAFWMLGQNIGSAGWPGCGEIDIMENIGRTPDSVYGTTHGPGPGSYPGNGLSGADNAGSAFGDGFHVYATQWGPGEIDFYVDGNLYWKVVPSMLPAGASWVWDQPFFMILNFAVGGNWPGNPDGSSSWPQQMLVDYVRVYSK
jgi:beta-glucanase (GH16 family)